MHLIKSVQKNFWQLEWKLERKVEKLESELQQQTLAPTTCKKLIRRLDQANSYLKELEKTAVVVDGFARKKIEQLQDKIANLYGELGTHVFDYEVCKIVTEASELEISLHQENMTRILHLVESLTQHLDTFHQNFRPDGINFKQISAVEIFVSKVKYVLANSKGKTKEDLFGSLKATSLKKDFEDGIDPDHIDLVMELLEIAELFYEGQTSLAKVHFNQLPEWVKTKIRNYLSHEPLQTLTENEKTIFSILSVAHQMVHGPDAILKIAEMHKWFQELSFLKKESSERNQTRVSISFKVL